MSQFNTRAVECNCAVAVLSNLLSELDFGAATANCVVAVLWLIVRMRYIPHILSDCEDEINICEDEIHIFLSAGPSQVCYICCHSCLNGDCVC